MPGIVHTDMPHLTVRLGVCEESLPGPAGEGGDRGGGEDGIVQAGLPWHSLSQPVQRVARVRVTSGLGLGLRLTTTSWVWGRSGGGWSHKNYKQHHGFNKLTRSRSFDKKEGRKWYVGDCESFIIIK